MRDMQRMGMGSAPAFASRSEYPLEDTAVHMGKFKWPPVERQG